MTARDFCKKYVKRYETTESEILECLDAYLSGTSPVLYSEFPEADLPTDFIKNEDDLYRFEGWLEVKMWVWPTDEDDINNNILLDLF